MKIGHIHSQQGAAAAYELNEVYKRKKKKTKKKQALLNTSNLGEPTHELHVAQSCGCDHTVTRWF